MFGLSLGHLIILFVVVLLFGGSRKLPELGHALGMGMGAFKKGLEGKNLDDTSDDPSQPQLPKT